MCLKTVTETFTPNENMEVGYKVFRKTTYYSGKENPEYRYKVFRKSTYYSGKENPDYRNLYYQTFTNHRMGSFYDVPSSYEWYYTRAGDGQKYTPFYHIFANLEDAKRMIEYIDPHGEHREYVICEVICWDIRAIGTQSIGKTYRQNEGSAVPCFVAKNYRLMEEIKWRR